MAAKIDYDYIKADQFLIGEVTVDSARHLLFNTKVTSIQAVERTAREEWEGVRRRPRICLNLVDSIPTRLEDVVEAGGGWTAYTYCTTIFPTNDALVSLPRPSIDLSPASPPQTSLKRPHFKRLAPSLHRPSLKLVHAFDALAATSKPQARAALTDSATPQARTSLTKTSTTNLLTTPARLSRSATHNTPSLPRLSHPPPHGHARLATPLICHRRHNVSCALAPTHSHARLSTTLMRQRRHATQALSPPCAASVRARTCLATTHTRYQRVHHARATAPTGTFSHMATPASRRRSRTTNTSTTLTPPKLASLRHSDASLQDITLPRAFSPHAYTRLAMPLRFP
ncbi:hypothetical protein Pcinc_009003 [Petrolisthes cinctipes]|uniref:Uncharacterized protein n=1 Tax=Petrolisthes cinctipes TaxID=88211 RepID=A0AAE1G882_PETCI|nr:hypothetical protein Pcinc_009003 [Petrolisthes cinctipes]